MHCYILEKIELHPEDVGQVERAYNEQLRAIAFLENTILMSGRLTEQYFNELKELQESRILPFFSHIVAKGGCSKETLLLLLKNVNKDLSRTTNSVSEQE